MQMHDVVLMPIGVFFWERAAPVGVDVSTSKTFYMLKNLYLPLTQ